MSDVPTLADPALTIDRPDVLATSFRPTRRAVWSWALYDLANTIFSINIVSLHFSLWVVDDMGGRDAHFTVAASISMALMFLSAPLLGALSDYASRRLPFLVATTLACCALTALLGLGGIWMSLALFVIANYFYQAGLLFYDTLLPSVSDESNRGRVGGFGVGVGYLGSVIGIGIGALVLATTDDRTDIFRLTALAYLLFALPCFLYVRERPRRVRGTFSRDAVAQVVRTARHAFSELVHYPDLRRFLIGHMLYADAANTAIAVMGIYATKEVGFSDAQTQIILLVGILGAIGGGVGIGRLVDRIGPKRSLLLVLLVWLATLGLIAVIGLLDLPRALFWPAAVLAGIALGGTWASDRPFMIRLTPPERLGEFYGLYSMVGRFAAMLGPLLWAILVDALGWGRPVAVLGLSLFIVAAMIVVRPVNDRPRG